MGMSSHSETVCGTLSFRFIRIEGEEGWKPAPVSAPLQLKVHATFVLNCHTNLSSVDSDSDLMVI